ncbi:MAG: YdcF family protein [Nitrospirae bacterium]|nr:YdcF family protein [Nitrospirota bacterium]
MVALVLINPLTLVFIGMVFLAVTKKNRRVFAICLTLYFYLFSISFTSYWVSNLWGVADTYNPEEKYEAAVVLAGVLDVEWYSMNNSLFYIPNNYIHPTSSTERLLAGVHFVKTGHAEQLLIGQWTYCPINKAYKSIEEAEKVKLFLVSQGVNENKLVLYANVNRTLDEARGVKAYTERNRIKKILLITSWMHMRRSIAMFKNIGLTPDIFSTNKPQTGKLSWTSFVPSLHGIAGTFDCVYELAAYGFYYAKGDLLP